MSKFKRFFQDVKTVFPITLPVLFGYLALSLAYALLAVEKGFSVWFLAGMSVMVYGGAIQMLAIDLFFHGASLLTFVVTTAVVQARHVAYGLAMVPAYRHAERKLPYLAFALTDETYAILSSVPPPAGIEANRYRFIVTVLNHFYWVAGTVLAGGISYLLHQILADGAALVGADFALTALFLVLALEQFLAGAERSLFVIGSGSGLLGLVLFGADRMLLPAVILAVVALLTYNARKGGNKKEGGGNHIF